MKRNQPMDPLVREFIRMIPSQRGQQVVVKDGYIPLPAQVAERFLAEIQ